MRKIFTLLLTAACSSFASQADTQAYGFIFTSESSQCGWVTFDVDRPQDYTPQKQMSYSTVRNSAGEYVDGKIYAYTVTIDEFGAIDTYGWAVYDAQTLSTISEDTYLDGNYVYSRRMADMAYDYTTNTMYGLIENEYTTGSVALTSLCAIDMTTGQYRIIGETGEITALDGYNHLVDDGLITLACDAEGQLYAMSQYRYLYKVDKFTGKAYDPAPRHNLGTGAYFQSMAFAADGTLYWAVQHPDRAFFCSVDMTTGIPGGFVDFRTDYEKLNQIGTSELGDQLTALYFKDKEINKSAPQAVTDFKATAHGDGVKKVDLAWVLPTKDYSGNDADIQGVKIYRLGTSEPIATVPAGTTTFTDENAPDGKVTYEILPYNASGNGFPAFAETFAGCDELKEVQNISVAVTDRNVTLTWEKPVATVNGGFADYDAITYNIYRCLGNNEQLVKENTAETQFSETISENGTFYYVIEAISRGIVGKRAQSDSFLLTSTASIPYSTGFEDDQDGSQWTFINSSNYGWSIAKGTRAFDGKYADGATGGSAALGDDWLISPAIEFPAGTYTLSFYANGASYDTHTVDILLGSDKADTSSFTKLIHAFNKEKVYDPNGSGAAAQWIECEYDFTVETAGTYHLGFHNKTTTTFAHFAVDNLSIKAKDSGITDISTDNESATAPIYYNMQGVKVENPANGIYIVRRGNKITKEIIH